VKASLMKNVKLSSAIAIGLIVGFLIPAVLAGWHTLQKQREILKKETDSYHFRIAKILSLGMQEPIWAMAPESGKSLIDAVMTDQQVLRILITTEKGTFLEEKTEKSDDPDNLKLVLPILYHKLKIGEVLVEIDPEQMESTLANQRDGFFLMCLIQFAASLMIIYVLLNIKLLKPVERLIRQSEKLARKELDEEFRWEQNDEIGLLGQSFEQSRRALLLLFSDLAKAKDAAEAANRAKSEFLANMSHEIRTPMNAILGFTELLSSSVKDEQQQSWLQAIQSGGKSLLTLINDILDLSKIEAGKLEIQYHPVNPHTIFNEIRQIFAMRISEKNLEFITDIAKDIPESLLLDEARLRQVLFNLIGNAVKFTESGYIKISATCEMQNDNFTRCTLRFALEDTGIGIAPESQEKIFEAFLQQDGQSTRKYGGTGLGLAITKRLVEMMKGNISLESKPGKGSIFRITLHRVAVPETLSKSDENLIADFKNITFENITILIADDVGMNRFLIKAFFKDMNIRIIEAENGRQAVEIAEQTLPDIILMDISMPEMDGYEATKQIKENEASKHIPVIALTAHALAHEKESILGAGFDGYLAKPVKRADLFREFSRFLRYSLKEKLPQDQSSPESALRSTEAIKKLPEIIHRLENEFHLLWKTARESGNFADIQEFADRIRIFGEQYSLTLLIVLGKNLLIHVGNFDIDNIESDLNSYPELLEEIKKIK
jgi:two-component system sensor histidine kinase EvgS